LRGGGSAEAGVVAVPEGDVVGVEDALDGVGEVLGLEVGELLLLVAQFDVEEVVVDLGDEGLERDAALDAGGRDERSDDVARVDKAACGGRCWDGRLLEVARRMAGGRDLLDALAEDAAAADDIGDLGLVERDFDGSGSDVVGGVRLWITQHHGVRRTEQERRTKTSQTSQRNNLGGDVRRRAHRLSGGFAARSALSFRFIAFDKIKSQAFILDGIYPA
jgi:hypothetical protein